MKQKEKLTLSLVDLPLMEIKKRLLNWKKSGAIFTPNDLSTLKMEDPLEIYFALTPGEITYRNAFPVLTEQYSHYPKDMGTHNRHYYHQYYLDDKYRSDEFYLAYQPFYVTKKWIWYYKLM
jgi:hypothetical protein